jgi:hypothetical protein
MNKVLKWILIVTALLLVVMFVGFKYMQSQTKKHSPENNVALKVNGLEMSVFYNQPSKKGRDIFGALVPYGEVWRTGANEATTFTTNQSINFGGIMVDPGTYTLWTIPGEEKWTVILNKGEYGWGVSMKGVASRVPEKDVASVVVASEKLDAVVEKFTIELNENPVRLDLMWDLTKVSVPIE